MLTFNSMSDSQNLDALVALGWRLYVNILDDEAMLTSPWAANKKIMPILPASVRFLAPGCWRFSDLGMTARCESGAARDEHVGDT